MKLKVNYKGVSLLQKLPSNLALIMKLTAVLLLATFLQVSAAAYSQKITLLEKNASLETVFKKIMKQSDYMFLYNNELLLKAKNVSIDVKAESIDKVLEKCFIGQPVTYTIVEKTVVVKSKISTAANIAPLPPLTIKGKVVDEKKLPLPGASVSLKDGNINAVTNANGQFSISVPETSIGTGILVVNFIGYQKQEIKITAGLDNLTIKMEPLQESLSEVVVIGYGTQKKTNVTGAVATFNNDNLNERAITRVDQALVGQLAGVTVKQTTGVPGKAFSIQVRGTGSISAGNEPLYVLDGFPLSNASTNGAGNFATGNPLDNINPNDIESIQVLKDAAAAAIYGSRASNGVVLITTKRGKTGKPKISYNTYAGYNQANRQLEMLDGAGWIDRATEMINTKYVADYTAQGATASDDYETRRQKINLTIADPTKQLQPGQLNVTYFLDPRWAQPGHPGLQFVNWQDRIFQKGLMQNHEVSASGGTEAVKYFVSGNFADQNGFVKGLGYKSYSARANVEVDATEKLKVGLNIAPTYSITQDPGVEGKDNIFHQSLSMTPVQEESVGDYPNVFNNNQYAWSTTTNSPVAKLENIVGETKRYRTLASMYGEYKILKNLTFRTSLNLDNTDNTARSYVPYTVSSTLASRTFDPNKPALTTNTSGSFNTYKRQTFVNENTLNYNTIINKDHSLNVLLGQSYNVDRTDLSAMASSGGYTSSVIQSLSAAVAITGSTDPNRNGATKNVLLSYFSRLQYSYKDKYLLSASLRQDGSSRFGDNTKWGLFPSASIGWRASEEEFMQKVSAISDLKLRASIGVNGTNNLGSDYGSIPTLVSAGYVFGSTPAAVIGQAPSKIANPDLQWERSVTYDLGVDFGFLSNRITGSFDYYNKLNTELLLNVQVPGVTGFPIYLNNTGSVRNVGQELELTSRNTVGKFQWNTTLNFSHNTNKVVALGPGQTQVLIPSAFDISNFILKVGEPMNSIYVVKQIGNLTQEDITNNAARFGTETVGDPKYQDFSGPNGVPDGVIDANDRQIVGHPNPDFIWGINNSFKYKGFDLNVLIQGQNGGSIYSLLGRAITRTGQGVPDNAPAFYENRWRSPEDPGDGRVSKASSTFGRIVNTDWLYSSNYLRVRNITLGYDLGGLMKKKVVQGARIYATAENFFGRDKYYGGVNPEATNTDLSGSSNFLSPGDYGGLPLAKSLIIGLNITF